MLMKVFSQGFKPEFKERRICRKTFKTNSERQAGQILRFFLGSTYESIQKQMEGSIFGRRSVVSPRGEFSRPAVGGSSLFKTLGKCLSLVKTLARKMSLQ